MKKKELKNIFSTMNVLIYDDKNITYYTCVPTSINIGFNVVETTSPTDAYRTFVSFDDNEMTITTRAVEEHENITLDSTLMKRIAKFNKEQECLRLDEEIKKKKEQIKELEEVLNDRTKRLKKLKDFICGIYDIDIDDDEDDEYYDY